MRAIGRMSLADIKEAYIELSLSRAKRATARTLAKELGISLDAEFALSEALSHYRPTFPEYFLDLEIGSYLTEEMAFDRGVNAVSSPRVEVAEELLEELDGASQRFLRLKKSGFFVGEESDVESAIMSIAIRQAIDEAKIVAVLVTSLYWRKIVVLWAISIDEVDDWPVRKTQVDESDLQDVNAAAEKLQGELSVAALNDPEFDALDQEVLQAAAREIQAWTTNPLRPPRTFNAIVANVVAFFQDRVDIDKVRATLVAAEDPQIETGHVDLFLEKMVAQIASASALGVEDPEIDGERLARAAGLEREPTLEETAEQSDKVRPLQEVTRGAFRRAGGEMTEATLDRAGSAISDAGGVAAVFERIFGTLRSLLDAFTSW